MPRDGNGVYSKPAGIDASPDTTIESADWNAFTADVEQDLNTATPIVAGGTGKTTAVAAADALSTQGANIASASTTNLALATGVAVTITGTTTITAFGTVSAGAIRILTFAGALVLTHNAASLILPGGANITTAAGDTAELLSLGSGNWRVVRYTRADGTAIPAAANAIVAALSVAPWIPVNNGSAVTVDFDTITTPGWHNRLLTDDGTVHGPGVASRFYYVQVIETASGNLIQEAYPYRVGTEKKYIRTRFSGSWSAWKQEAYLDDVLPLAGGTLTGAVSGITPTNAAHLTRKDYVDGQDIGIGQTWQSVTRSVATSYQNTTGKPIMVNVSANGSSAAGNFQVSPDNSTWVTVGLIYSNAQDVRAAEAVVPAGHYYKLTAGTATWVELR